MIKKLLLLAAACAFLFGCKKDDDASLNDCPQPGAIQITELNSGSVLFTWGVNEETAWEFEYGLTNFTLGSGTVRQTSETNFFLDGLTPATGYDLYLRANCGSDGFSSYVFAQFVTSEATPNCNVPTDLFLADLGATFISIGWTENDETAWEVEYGPVGFPIGTGTVESTSESTYTINGLPPSTTFEIYVRANCGSEGFSDESEPIVITTNGS